jgi:hypothetical protein
MASQILSVLPAHPEKIAVSNTKGNCLLTFVKDAEHFTEKQEKELIGVHIAVYTLINDTYIKVQTKQRNWKSKENLAVPISGIPTNCYLELTPIIDKRIVSLEDDNGTIYYDIVPEIYVKNSVKQRLLDQQHLETQYNVSVQCDVDVLPSGGGESAEEVEQIVMNTLIDNNVLAFDA